jgi:hypothetical protein
MLASGAKVHTIKENDLKSAIFKIVGKAYALTGFKAPSYDDANFMVNELSREVARNHKNLTLEELSEAMDLGAKKTFGEYMGLSVVTFSGWFTAFKNYQKRIDELHAANKPKPTMIDLSDKQKKEIAEESIRVMLEHFKKTGEVLNMGNANFRYLWNSGQIRFDAEQAQKYLDIAMENVTESLMEQRQTAKETINRGEVKRLDNLMDSLTDTDTAVKIEAGKLAIIEWVKKL